MSERLENVVIAIEDLLLCALNPPKAVATYFNHRIDGAELQAAESEELQILVKADAAVLTLLPQLEQSDKSQLLSQRNSFAEHTQTLPWPSEKNRAPSPFSEPAPSSSFSLATAATAPAGAYERLQHEEDDELGQPLRRMEHATAVDHVKEEEEGEERKAHETI